MEELSDATGVMEVDRTYSYGLDLIAQDRFDVGSSAWDATFYLYDGHGNVRALADDAGTITDTYDYDAFGTLIEQLVLDLSASGLVPVTTDNRDLTTDNQYLYCGEQFDPDLDLYFLRARYMDTDRGRFWSMDVFEGMRQDPETLHKYTYVGADPINFLDPSGLSQNTYLNLAIVMAIEGMLSSMTSIHVVSMMNPDADMADLMIAGSAGLIGGAVGVISPGAGTAVGAFLASWGGAIRAGCTPYEASLIATNAAAIGGAAAWGMTAPLDLYPNLFSMVYGGVVVGGFTGLATGAWDSFATLTCLKHMRPELEKELF